MPQLPCSPCVVISGAAGGRVSRSPATCALLTQLTHPLAHGPAAPNPQPPAPGPKLGQFVQRPADNGSAHQFYYSTLFSLFSPGKRQAGLPALRIRDGYHQNGAGAARRAARRRRNARWAPDPFSACPPAAAATGRVRRCATRLWVPETRGQRGPRRRVARVSRGWSRTAPSGVAARNAVAGASSGMRGGARAVPAGAPAIWLTGVCRRWQWDDAVQELSAVSVGAADSSARLARPR